MSKIIFTKGGQTKAVRETSTWQIDVLKRDGWTQVEKPAAPTKKGAKHGEE